MGANAFALDRCPRCAICLAIPNKGDLTDEQVSRVWAIHRATRIFQAQRALQSYLAPPVKVNPTDPPADRAGKRMLLELIRDHIDCSVPYLHWMIALEAGSRADDVRLETIARLHEFGPMFQDKATLFSEGDAWVRAIAECNVGLFGSFEMFKPELQAAMTGVNISPQGGPPATTPSIN